MFYRLSQIPHPRTAAQRSESPRQDHSTYLQGKEEIASLGEGPDLRASDSTAILLDIKTFKTAWDSNGFQNARLYGFAVVYDENVKWSLLFQVSAKISRVLNAGEKEWVIFQPLQNCCFICWQKYANRGGHLRDRVQSSLVYPRSEQHRNYMRRCTLDEGATIWTFLERGAAKRVVYWETSAVNPSQKTQEG